MSRITQKGAAGVSLQANGSFQSSSDVNLNTMLGTRYDLSDGREVILVSAGGVTIATAGLLVQDLPVVANHQNLTVTAFTAYSNNGNVPASVVVTLGATAAVANQYQGGFAVINSGPGIGQTLRIASSSAAAASTSATITLEDAPNTALTTSSKVCLIPAHGSNVVVFPTTVTGAAVGVTLYPLSSGTTATPTVGFVVSKGLTSALSDAAIPAAGAAISPSTSVAGAITASPTQNTVGTLIVGYANQTAVSAEARSVFVNL